MGPFCRRIKRTCADTLSERAHLKSLPSVLSLGNADHDKGMPAAAFSMHDTHALPGPSSEDERYQTTASVAERAENKGIEPESLSEGLQIT